MTGRPLNLRETVELTKQLLLAHHDAELAGLTIRYEQRFVILRDLSALAIALIGATAAFLSLGDSQQSKLLLTCSLVFAIIAIVYAYILREGLIVDLSRYKSYVRHREMILSRTDKELEGMSLEEQHKTLINEMKSDQSIDKDWHLARAERRTTAIGLLVLASFSGIVSAILV